MARYSVEIPVRPGDRLLVYENLVRAVNWKLGEPEVYEVTNITITQNKKKQWTKKIRAMLVRDNKTTPCGLTLNFEDIGVKAFLQEA